MLSKVLVTGSNGMIGSAACAFFRSQGQSVIRLVRSKSHLNQDTIYWNPVTEEIHLDQLEGFDAVLHFAGDNISNQRWSRKKKESIFRSRCRDTWLLSQALSRLQRPPKFFFCASAIGYYGNRGDEILTEESLPGQGFLAELCIQWEEATQAAKDRGIRVVHGRFGAVLSPNGGLLKRALPAFRMGLGATLGTGKQYMSWICLSDLVRAIDFIREKTELSGTYNFTSFYPITNAEFTTTLARHLHRKAFLRIPAPILKILLGERGEALLLSSARALPKRLIQAGFTFSTPTLSEALAHLL